jgi:hypothetical protein
LCSRLFVCFLYSLVVMLGCGVAVSCEVPHVEIFRVLGLAAVMAFTALGFLAMSVNFAGTVISCAERYRRSNPIRQKQMKSFLFSRSIPVRAASYRAGRARSSRRARSAYTHTSGDGDGSNDGGSDSGEGDPSKPVYFLCPVTLSQALYSKSNSFPSPWRFLRGPGCCRMRFSPAPAGRGWGK